MSVVTWYGHSAFKLECEGSSVIIDPFFAPGCGFDWQDAGKVDFVLVTHDHGDHVGSAVEICRRWNATLGAIVGTAQKLVQEGVPQANVGNGIGYNIGGTLTCAGIAATMAQAFHSSDSGMPAAYIVRMPDGLTVYHAGDTGIFSSMSLLGQLYDIDVALMPIGGVFTMDAYQAAHACKLLGCRAVVPMHWGTFPALAQSPEQFKEQLAMVCPQCQCIVMEKGKGMEMQRD